MEKWIISTVAMKIFSNTCLFPIIHLVDIYYCHSRQEAIGYGYELLQNRCPSADGWGNYHVIVLEDKAV